jgi:hypothetical protein
VEDDDSNPSKGGPMLDLSRIHLLQRDLVDFSEDAFAFADNLGISSKEINHMESGEKCNEIIESSFVTPDPIPLSMISAETQKSLESLRLRAQNLVVHLACLAPVAPLSRYLRLTK